ncbi:hypothetical protein [Streptomyces rectiverticillatus]|uniref:hypothetical protein n=1 Tax=Streptomyces rectiverticillatus TaxID=173860 RepID=UPI0015C32E5A|nr:hypothetical protein [Streptomyces rectiverticillatus]
MAPITFFVVGATVVCGALATVPAVVRRGAAARPLGAGEIGYLHDGRKVGGQVRMP